MMDKAEREKLRERAERTKARRSEDIIVIEYADALALLDHIDALEKRLFGALETDRVLRRAVENIDHAESLSRSLMSDVVDLANIQKERIDALERDLLAAAIAISAKLPQNSHALDTYHAKAELLALRAAIASAQEVKK
jgi:hypothetical protein